MPNLKREIARKQKNIEELKSDKAEAWEAHRQSEAKVEKIIAVFTERVRTAEKEAEQANVRAEVANNNVEAVREYWKGHAAATEKKCEAEVEAVKKQADAYRYTADTMVATVKKQCNAEVDAARSREAAAKENYKGEVDATKIKAREKVMEHKKRTAAVLDDVKTTAKEKRTQLTMKQKEAAEKKDMKSAERLKELKERLSEEKKSTEVQRKSYDNVAVDNRRHFRVALKTERQFYHLKVVEKRKRLRDKRLEDIDRMDDLRSSVYEAKAESKVLRKQLSNIKLQQRDLKEEHNALLKTVTQLEMDQALSDDRLEKAVEEASTPEFVFEMERYGIRSKRWSLRIIQLILELLVAGTPPSSINASIVAFVKNLAPHVKVKINHLPSIWFIRRCRSVLLIVCQLLAAHRLANSPKCGAMHSDGTGRRQTEIVNLVISAFQEGDPSFVPIVFSASILPEDGTADGIHESIITFLEEKKVWLAKWKAVIERDFPQYKHNINPSELDIAKLADGGLVMTDGCNTARSFNRKMVATIKAKALAKRNSGFGDSVGSMIAASISDTATAASNEVLNGVELEDDDTQDDTQDEYSDSKSIPDVSVRSMTNNPLVLEVYCHHHIRNIWWGALIKHTSRFLRDSLSGCLDNIDARLRVQPNMKNILRSLDKCFSFPANYPKGNGAEFQHWAKKFHPGVALYPVQRSTGARHNMVLEGAVAAYINAWLYKLFLDEGLSTPDADNILEENLFIILSSMEMIALSRLFSILHFTINVPMRWLAGKYID